MYRASPPLHLFTSFALICVLALGVFADTVRLKDGSLIKGRITGFADGRFTIVIGDGARQRQLSFGADEVESIEFDNDNLRQDTSPSPAVVSRDTRPVSTTPDERRPAPRVVVRDTAPSATPASAPSMTAKGTNASQPVPASAPASPSPSSTASAPVVSDPKPSTSAVKPIEVSVKVLADNTANGWTNSGWVVKKGQQIRITGTGTISLGNGKSVEPSGSYDLEDGSKLLKSVPTGALIAVIGVDNNDFIYVGAERTFTAARDGELFLGVNEGNLNDNSGSFDVKIEIRPA